MSKETEIYGKTYGASKYVTAMLGFTGTCLIKSTDYDIIFYKIMEKNLKYMPKL